MKIPHLDLSFHSHLSHSAVILCLYLIYYTLAALKCFLFYGYRYLAIDETDRMVEQGHFQELKDLLEMLNSNKEAKAKRQTFVFSATLTMVHQAPKRLAMKRKVGGIQFDYLILVELPTHRVTLQRCVSGIHFPESMRSS